MVGKAERLTWHKAWTMVSTGFSISYTSSAVNFLINLLFGCPLGNVIAISFNEATVLPNQ
ncbi:hypothetical protein BLX75_05035 [Salmonella enterica subsp. enterica serovar Typhimurium]|nr:hypothetical protein BLX75_05035 [Salmonella enterica subsp. enterica serovar Typhimurium]